MTTNVETAAIARRALAALADRLALGAAVGPAASPRGLNYSSAVTAVTRRRRAHPLLLDLRELAGGLERVDAGETQAVSERVLLEERTPLVALGAGELADDRRRRHLTAVR